MKKLAAAALLSACLPATAQAQILAPILTHRGSTPTPSFTLVQHVVKDCTNVSTCTANVSSTGSGNVITVDFLHYNVYSTAADPVGYVSSTDSVGTCLYKFQPSTWQETDGNGNGYMTNLHSYCLSSNAGATTVSMVINGTLDSGAIASMTVEEWAPIGGSPVFDAGQTVPFTPCTTCASPTLTLTGSADLVIQDINTPVTASAITGSWDFKNFDATYAHSGFASAKGGTGSSFNWTNSAAASNHVGMSGYAIGIGATPCSNSWIVDWTGGTSGNAPLAADLLSSTFGAAALNFKASEATQWTTTNTGPGVKYATLTPPALNSSMRFCTGGTTYSNSPTKILQYSSTSAPPQYVSLFTPNQDFTTQNATSFSSCVLIQTDWTNASVVPAQDVFTESLNGGNFVNTQIQNSGGTQLTFTSEVSSGSSGQNPINFNTATWYQLCAGYSTILQTNPGGGGGVATFAAATGYTGVWSSDATTQQGTTYSHSVGAAQVPLKLVLGSSAGSAGPSGSHINFGPAKICVSVDPNAVCPFPNLL